MNIVITGASAGIGYALARRYAQPGATLGLLARNPDRLNAIREVCVTRGAMVEVGIVNVTDGDMMRDWLLGFDARHPIDVLIANAGVTSIVTQATKDEVWADICNVVNVNIFGVFNSIHPLIERMRTRRHGQIAIMSSLAALKGMPVSPSYCASKAAVRAYGDALRPLLKQDGVKVSVICPGFVDSEMSASFPDPKPFKITAEKAATHIKIQLARNKSFIYFPTTLYLGLIILNLLPTFISDKIIYRFGLKTKKTINSA